MESNKIKKFMKLAGQPISNCFIESDLQTRKLGAQLLLSEVLEYVIDGLGIIPEANGVKITQPNEIKYTESDAKPDKISMLDGLADVAYTMYWNAEAFGVPLEEGFELVCDNNLEKFINYKTGLVGQEC
jgi:predicted HAD superfamily Cof-like phosphohydrolase